MTQLYKATTLALLMSLTGVCSNQAIAAPDLAKIEERKNAKTKIMGERTGKKVIKAFDLFGADDVDGAIALLLELKPKSDFDKATVNRFLGNMYAQKEKYNEAIKYIRAALAPDALNFKEQGELFRLLGDLSRGTNKYQDAISAYNDWMDFTGETDAKVYAAIAGSYYELKQFRNIIVPADKAIKLAEEPKKQYFDLKIAAYYSLKQYKNLVNVAETIVKTFPDEKGVWKQLGQFYTLTEQFSEGLTTFEVAFSKDEFEKESDYKLLAQFYALAGNPYKAALTYKQSLKDGKIERNKKNVQALGSNYHQARHFKLAAKYYKEAAKFDNDAELYLKAGSLQLTAFDYKGAVVSLEKAIELDTDKIGTAYTDLAEAYLYQNKFKKAYAAIKKAAKEPESRKFAKGWMPFIKGKAERNGVKI